MLVDRPAPQEMLAQLLKQLLETVGKAALEDLEALAQTQLIIPVEQAVLVVKAVQTSVKGTVYVLERASDAAPVSVEVTGKVASGVAVSVGTAVQVSVISAGTVLSVAGKAIAFIPNEVGKALLHNQRLTQ